MLAPRDIPTFVLLGSGAAVGTIYGAGVYRTVHRLGRRWNMLEDAARTDSLTKLGNRRALAVDYDGFVASGAGTLSFVLWDIDGLKDLNDRYGHGAGDRHILEFVGWLKHYGRRSDLYYRWRDDEFVSLHPLDRLGDADPLHGFVCRVRNALPAVSAGWIHVEYEEATLEQAVAEANTWLYREKRAKSTRKGRGDTLTTR